MIGTPSSGVTAFKGSKLLLKGMIVTKLQKSAIAEPKRIVAGSNNCRLDFFKVIRATCGTINPIKLIGPQKAVIVAIKKPVIRRIRTRIFFMLIPKLIA